MSICINLKHIFKHRFMLLYYEKYCNNILCMNRRALLTQATTLFGALIGAVYLNLSSSKDKNADTYKHELIGRPFLPPGRTFSSPEDFFSVYGSNGGSLINYYLKEKGFVHSKKITLTADKMGIIISTIYKSKKHFELAEGAFAINGSEEKSVLPDHKKVVYSKILS